MMHVLIAVKLPLRCSPFVPQELGGHLTASLWQVPVRFSCSDVQDLRFAQNSRCLQLEGMPRKLPAQHRMTLPRQLLHLLFLEGQSMSITESLKLILQSKGGHGPPSASLFCTRRGPM